MQKHEILDRVFAFCDVRGDTFLWRNEPFRSELFRLFQESHAGPGVTGEEIHSYVRYRWSLPDVGTCRCKSAWPIFAQRGTIGITRLRTCSKQRAFERH